MRRIKSRTGKETQNTQILIDIWILIFLDFSVSVLCVYVSVYFYACKNMLNWPVDSYTQIVHTMNSSELILKTLKNEFSVASGLLYKLNLPQHFRSRYRDNWMTFLLQGGHQIRARNETSRSFYNHGEGPYKGLLLVQSAYQSFHITLFNTINTLC